MWLCLMKQKFLKSYLVREGIRHFFLGNIKNFLGRPLFLEESLLSYTNLSLASSSTPEWGEVIATWVICLVLSTDSQRKCLHLHTALKEPPQGKGDLGHCPFEMCCYQNFLTELGCRMVPTDIHCQEKIPRSNNHHQRDIRMGEKFLWIQSSWHRCHRVM